MLHHRRTTLGLHYVAARRMDHCAIGVPVWWESVAQFQHAKHPLTQVPFTSMPIATRPGPHHNSHRAINDCHHRAHCPGCRAESLLRDHHRPAVHRQVHARPDARSARTATRPGPAPATSQKTEAMVRRVTKTHKGTRPLVRNACSDHPWGQRCPVEEFPHEG